jgi:glucosyl-dolichyl phosphate glucuronosyltransferase
MTAGNHPGAAAQPTAQDPQAGDGGRVVVSVVICTYNRCEMLRITLASLTRQTVAPDRFEVIVVDNASTDGTPAVVREAQGAFPEHTIRYIHEPQPGASVARNTGLANAVAPLVAFTDDDVKVPPTWLGRAAELFERLEERPMCVGGKIVPFYTEPIPEWFADRYEIRSWGESARWLRTGEAFPGAHMIWDRAVLVDAGAFDARRGPKGDMLEMGEDTEVFKRIWRADPQARFYYDPTLVVAHWLPANKTRVGYRLRRHFARGRDSARAALGVKDRGGRFRLVGKFTAKLAKSLVHALAYAPRHRRWQTWVVEEIQMAAFHFGRVVGALGIYIPIRQR